MSSTGQIVGAIVGGVVGFVVAGPQGALKGAAYGASIGAALDPPPGPDLEGPRIADGAEQTSSYGAPVNTINGKIAVSGTVVWVENNKKKIVAKKEDSGGGKGGGGGSETTTYEAFVTCAILLADHEVDGIGKLWFGSNLVSNGLTDDLATAAASNELFPTLSLHTDSGLLKASLATNPNSGTVRLYPGYDDQPVDPRMEADLGAGNCPSYRGMTVLFLYDYPLKDYSNSIAGLQVKAELIKSGANDSPTLLNTVTYQNSLGEAGSTQCMYLNAEEAYVVSRKTGSFPPEHATIEVSQDGHIGPGAYTEYGNGFAQGWSDTARFFDVYPLPYPYDPDTTLIAGLGSTQGRAVYKNDTIYGFQFLGWLYPPGQTRVATSTAPRAMAVDDSGNIYVVHGSNPNVGTSGIDKYTQDGTFVEFKHITFTNESYTTRGLEAVWDSSTGLLWLGFTRGSNIVTRFYAVDFDSGSVSDAIDIDAESPAEVSSNFNIEGGVLTRHWYDAVAYEGHVERWRLPTVDSSGQSLASVVREKMERSELIEPADIDVSLLTGDVSYKTSGITSIRSTVAPLMAAYNFDVIESGYQLKCVPRGQSSVMTIDYNDLDARPFGSAPGVAIDQQREMDSQLPRQMLLNYIDAGRNYNQNQAQSIERLSSKAINKESYELALVFTPAEADGQTNAQMDRRWLERDDFAFTIPQTYNRLEPADVVTLDAGYAEYEFRLSSVGLLADGRVECTAKLNDSAIYTQNATGGTRIEGDSTIAFAGASVMHLLDIPLIRDEDDKPGFAGSLCGKSTGWPGGTIIRSIDSGQTFQPIQGFASGVTAGVCRDSLPAHDGYVIDRANTLTIDLYNSSFNPILYHPRANADR